MKKILFLLPLLSILISCSEDDDNKVEAFQIKPANLELTIGDNHKIEVTFTPAEADTEFKWESEDENIATVDENGTVHAIAQGETKINALEVKSNLSSSLSVKVYKQKPTAIKLQYNKLEIEKGDTITIGVETTPPDADTEKIIWESSDPGILTVDKNGKVTALKEGRASISIQYEGITQQDQCEIIVTLPASIKIYNEDDLFRLVEKIKDGERMVITIMDEIILTQKWQPLGNPQQPFIGTIIGNDFGIELDIESTNEYVGFIGYAKDTEIKNLQLYGNIKSPSASNTSYTGSFIGSAQNTSIENCCNFADISAEHENSGGIIGKGSGVNIINTANHGTITGPQIAGIISHCTDNSLLKYCINDGDLFCKYQNAAGIVNHLSSSQIINSGNSANIYADQAMVYSSGIASDVINSTIKNSFNKGSMNGIACAGIACNVSANSNLLNSYNAAPDILYHNEEGSLSGLFHSLKDTEIKNCYSKSVFPAAKENISLIGNEISSATIRNCYYLKQNGYQGVSGKEDIQNSYQGLTADQFSQKETFKEWNFGTDDNNPWILSNGFPALYWEYQEDFLKNQELRRLKK